jgi:class 3 adenylate cyclase/putative methionine-R-sulfoxide reductase with GAF domain
LEDILAAQDGQTPMPERDALVGAEGLRTYLYVPLLDGEKAVGCIALSRREVRPFAEDEIALVETFAAQAVIAIENVRQFREVRTRLEREKASAEILEVISRSRDDEAPVLAAIVQNAARLCDASLVGLSLVNEARDALVYACIQGSASEYFHLGFEFDLEGPLQVAKTVREARTIHTRDLSDHPLYHARDPVRVNIVEAIGVRTFLTVPLLKEGNAIGCLNLNRNEVRPFDDADIKLIESFAAQAVIAIENVRQFKALEAQTAEVRALNSGLESRVAEQVGQIERMGRLKRFLPAAVADTVLSQGADRMLSSHRALLGVLFCDMRGFTAFCETAEPEETIEVLQTYHQEMGRLIAEHGAGVDHRMGDGIMVLFNDPLPCDDPAGDAVRLAIAMRARMVELCRDWKRMGHRLGFGVGVSLGYATVGMVGYEGRHDYTASGTAVNLAARLCDLAEDGDILLSPRARIAVEDDFATVLTGEVRLKGIQNPLEVYRLQVG